MSESFSIAGGGVVQAGDDVWDASYHTLPKARTVKGRGQCMTLWVHCNPGGDCDPNSLYSTEAEALDALIDRAHVVLSDAIRGIEKAQRRLKTLTQRRIAIAAVDPTAPSPERTVQP